jgi:hypothetical protein
LDVVGRRTGAWAGLAAEVDAGRKCDGQTFSMRSKSRTNRGRTTWAPSAEEETSRELLSVFVTREMNT